MKKLEDNYGELDVRILVDLFCIGGGKSTVTANRGIVKSGETYYEPNLKFFDFFEDIAEKQREHMREIIKKSKKASSEPSIPRYVR